MNRKVATILASLFMVGGWIAGAYWVSKGDTTIAALMLAAATSIAMQMLIWIDPDHELNPHRERKEK